MCFFVNIFGSMSCCSLVQEMKRQCDEKRSVCFHSNNFVRWWRNFLLTFKDFFRSVYEYMVTQQKEKGKPKGGKSESFTSQQVRAAHDAYDEEATLCVFRLKSLKQGQSRSLLTQAARHHAAQVFFLRFLKVLI